MQKFHGVLGVVALASFTALAKADDPLPSLTSRIGIWTLAPAATTGAVEGFLLWANDDAITGDNPSVLWYQRETDGSWQAWGWRSGNFCDAVAFARESLAYEDLFLENVQVADKLSECETTTRRPTPMIEGLFVDDPLAFLLDGSMESALFVEDIARSGGAAAPLISGMSALNSGGPVHMPGDCLTDDLVVQLSIDLLLNSVARSSELELFETTSIAESSTAIGLCWCSSKTVTTPLPDLLTSQMVGSALHCFLTKGRSRETTSYTGSTFPCCNSCGGPITRIKTSGPCYEFTAGNPLAPCSGQTAGATLIQIPCP